MLRMAQNAGTRLAVVGDDGSSAADTVWQWFTAHPWRGWAVEVVTADETNIVWGEAIEGKEWTPPWLRATNPEGAEVRYLQYRCDPRAMLAERSDADLLVVGRHRRKDGLEFLGSTSEWLLVHPPAPLAIIRDPDPISRVVMTADGSEHSRFAMETFCSLPAASGAAVTVLAVDDDRTDPAAADEMAQALEGRVGSVDTVVKKGRPTQQILETIGDTGADLVVLGTKGLTGWKRLRVGSTAGAIGRLAPCNVLVASMEAG